MVSPLSQMPSDLLKRINKIEKALMDARKDTLRAAAEAAKEAQQDVMRGDAGGDLILSRVRSGRGAKIGARYKLGLDGAEISATGPLPLLANPIKPHQISSKRGRSLAIPGIGVRASAHHPGTRGKDTWNRGREKAEPKVTKIVGKRTDDVVRKAFQSGG